MDAGVPVCRRPARLSAALAVVAAVLSVGLSASAAAAWPVVCWTGGCVGALALGRAMRRGARPGAGALLVLAAVLGLGVGLVLAVLGPADPVVALVLVPGVVGVALVGATLDGRGSRGLLRVGAGSVLASVLLAGITTTATRPVLLVAGGGAVLTFDLGEHAIGVGEQLGRRARTTVPELGHALGSVLVGAVGVGTLLAVRNLGRPTLPLSAFALLLVAVVLLAAALHE